MLTLSLALAARGDVCMPDRSPLPRRLELLLAPTGEPKPVWVAAQGCQALERPGPASPANPVSATTRRINFLDKRFLVRDPRPVAGQAQADRPLSEQVGGKVYYLLVRADPEGRTVLEPVGWVDRDLLILEPEARIDAVTHIYRKAMIINSPRSVRADQLRARNDPQSRALLEVEVRLAPDRQAPPLKDTFRVFNLFFVYGETDDFVLVGSRTAFEAEEVRQTVLGWLPRPRVCFWNTRQAMDWDWTATQPGARPRRTIRGATYRTPEQALAALRGQAAEPVHEEDLDENGVTTPLAYDQMHYPVFEFEGTDAVPRDIPGNRLRSVAGVGPFEGTNGARLSREQMDEIQRKINFIDAQVARTEILFVIDDTSSMKEWFPIAAETFERIARLLGGKPSGEVLASVCYYNDGDGPGAGVQPHPLRDLRTNLRALTEEVRDHQVRDGGDAPERVFRGIALSHQVFTQDNSRKLIVVLGDDGDKLEPGDFTAEDVAALLVPDRGSAVEFYAIQVADPLDADKRNFRAQMNRVVELAQARYRNIYGTGDDEQAQYVFAPSRDRRRIGDAILDRYRQLGARRGEWRAQLDDARHGRFNSRFGAQFLKILKENDVDLVALRAMRGVQVFEFGYTWEKDRAGLSQVRPFILISDRELDVVTKVLTGLSRAPDRAGRTTLDQLVESAVSAMVGQLPPGDRPADLRRVSLQEILLQLTGLEFQSAFLNKTAEELRAVDRRRTAEEKKKKVDPSRRELARIELCRMRLEDAKNGVRYEYESRSDDDGSGYVVDRWYRKGDPQPNPRAHFIRSDRAVLWYWIDFREEWP
jgi:hypothetical protein